jgi:hypothetical protein
LLFSSLGERLKIDKNFENQVVQRAEKANILRTRDFKKRLTTGLEELESKGILKPEEKKAIIGFYLGS